MDAVIPSERRRYRRYIVRGQVKFRTDSAEVSGDLVNVGPGGMLLRSDIVLSEGKEITIHAMVFGYPTAIEVFGRVASAKDGLMSIQFLKEPIGLFELVRWLARENYPWTVIHASEGFDTTPSGRAASTASTERMNEDELRAVLEHLYQLG